MIALFFFLEPSHLLSNVSVYIYNMTMKFDYCCLKDGLMGKRICHQV